MRCVAKVSPTGWRFYKCGKPAKYRVRVKSGVLPWTLVFGKEQEAHVCGIHKNAFVRWGSHLDEDVLEVEKVEEKK